MRRQIIPAILAKDLKDLKSKLSFLSNNFPLIQIDVMDGTLVKNVSFFDPKKIEAIPTKSDFELHLMVDNPEKIIKKAITFPRFRRLIIHYESYQHRKREIYDTIKGIRAAGREVGLAINPNTPISKVLEFLPNIDLLLVMGVTPGWSGQKFIPAVLKKIESIRKYYPKLDISVDGGVTKVNAETIFKSGANILNTASMILRLKGDQKEVKKLLKELRIKN